MGSLLTVVHGDCREKLSELAPGSVQMCVTSPPYWGLRTYLDKDDPDKAREIGQERTPPEFVATLVEVFRLVRAALAEDGTCWINLGDSYANGGRRSRDIAAHNKGNAGAAQNFRGENGLKEKDLVGIPWRVALALQADGWYLRQDIIWHKPNPMPESVTDRCTKAHEYLFLLSKSPRYYYDQEAIQEECSPTSCGNRVEFRGGGSYTGGNSFNNAAKKPNRTPGNKSHKLVEKYQADEMEHHRTAAGLLAIANTPFAQRNKRSVWTVASYPYSEAHFATFPPDLIKPCILAGSRPGDVVLDPFGGSGTVGKVALELGRRAVLVELNRKYLPLIERRTAVTPGLCL